MRSPNVNLISQEHGISLPESWKPGEPLPPDAMEILRKKFKLPEKRAALYEDEVVDDVETLRKRRKLENGDSAEEGGNSSDSSDSDSSDDDSDADNAPQKISLSLSSDDDSSDDDSE